MNTLAHCTVEQEVARYCAPGAMIEGNEGWAEIGGFEFENGGHVERLNVGYVTHGTLNAARDNAIVLMPGTTNTRHSADGYIGTGKAFDPQRHFIIALDAIGAGTSSKPSDGLGERFPAYNIRDMVRAQYRAVTEHFGLTTAAAVAGASMGAFQSLEWAIAFPAFARSAVLLVPAARASHVFRSVVRTAQEILELDPSWGLPAADMTGLKALHAAVRTYFPWTVSDSYLERVPLRLVEMEIQSAIRRSAQWHPWDYMRRYQASASHDVATPFGGDLALALGRVSAPTLLLPTSSERLLGGASGAELQRHIECARLVEVTTDRGHLGWRAIDGTRETGTVNREIRAFLEEIKT